MIGLAWMVVTLRDNGLHRPCGGGSKCRICRKWFWHYFNLDRYRG